MKTYLSTLILCFMCISCQVCAEANDYELSEIPIDHETDTFQSKFIHMLFILGLLIAFMVIASWALKRMMKTRVMQLNTGSLIKVQETRPLSPRSTLYLVTINGQNLLIAESQTAVTHLATLPADMYSPEEENN